MKYRIFILFLVIIVPAIVLQAQQSQTEPQVQWASRIVRISSQLKPTGQYSAEQLLGKPNIISRAGETNPCSWASGKDIIRTPVSITDIIRVAFVYPVVARQVVVAENFNPGAITAIIVYGKDKKDRDTVYRAQAEARPEQWRMLTVTFPAPSYKVQEVEIVTNVGLVPGQNEIDAIGLGTTADSIRAEIRLVHGLDEISPPENLGKKINSEAEEVLPIISPDGRTLFFCRKGHEDNTGPNKHEDIWFSTLQEIDGEKPEWGTAQNIGSPLNNVSPNFACSIMPDGNTMLVGNVYLPGGRMGSGVSLSYRTASGWGVPVKQVITDYQTAKPLVNYSLAADGKTLLMALERSNSLGGLDLYVSFLLQDGKWSIPKNLGNDVNTAGDESTIFLASDGKTLYFSSDGHNGYGSSDIFVTRRLDTSWARWTEPQNLGPTINTIEWDAYFSLPASGEYAYFVSERNSFGGSDIYRAPIPEALRPRPVVLISGKTLDAKYKRPLGAIIRYELLSNGKEIGIARSDSLTGNYSISLPAGELYGFRAEADGFVSVNENIDVRKLTRYQEMNRDLRLVKIEKGQSVLLNNIFFETGKWDLQAESRPELMRVVGLLKKNSTLTIVVAGYTDNIGNKKNNQTLSQKRAQAVFEFLQKNGISVARLSAKGFGDENPIAENDSEQGRQQNRRVEFIITSE